MTEQMEGRKLAKLLRRKGEWRKRASTRDETTAN
jgi:hypothetical protein